jgi:hypothetical protein
MTEMKSVYSAVRTGSLNKAVCASSLKGSQTGLKLSGNFLSAPSVKKNYQFMGYKITSAVSFMICYQIKFVA